MRPTRPLTFAALLLLASPARGVESSDGGFSLAPPEGWSGAPPAQGSVLLLKKGGVSFAVKRLPEPLIDEAMRHRIVAERADLLKRGVPVAEITVLPVHGGAGYLTGYGAPGAETGFGYFSVRGACYSFSAERAGLAPTLRLITAIRLPGQAVEAAPEDVPERRVTALGGRLSFPRVPGWRFNERADGWLFLEGPDFTFGLSSKSQGRPPEDEDGLKAVAASYLARADESLAACRPSAQQDESLANGWRALYKEYSCQTPSDDAMTTLSGIVFTDWGELFAMTGEYADPRRRGAVFDWLSRGRSLLGPKQGERVQEPASGRRPSLPAPVRRGLLALLGVVAATFLAAQLRNSGRRRPVLASGASHTRTGTLFPVSVREETAFLGRRFAFTDRLGRRYSAVGHGALSIFLRRSLSLYENGVLVMRVHPAGFSLKPRSLAIVDRQGQVLASLRRSKPWLMGKGWDLLDTRGEVFLSFRENGRFRPWARRVLGHLWGMLRSELDLLSGSERIGSIEREPTVRNNFFVNLKPEAERGIDHRIILAATLFIEVAHPDRWHPWYA